MTNKILLFIDESGKPDFDDTFYRHFLLTGVVIPETELPIISGYFSYIKRKYSLSLDNPFHTYDLLEKSNIKLGLNDAKNLVMSMSEFLKTCPIQVFFIHTDKDIFQKKYNQELEKTKLTLRQNNKGTIYFLSAYRQLQLFTDYLKRKKATGSIYADSRYNQDRDILDAYLKIRELQLKGGITNPYGLKSQHLLTSLTFANKLSLTAGLELTDFISFVCFAKIQRKMSQFKDIKLSKSWEAIESKLVNKKIFKISPSLMKQFTK